MSYSPQQRQCLLRLARDSIDWGLRQGCPLPLRLAEFDVELQQLQACFVTLLKRHRLRGCIGSLEARRPLVLDVVENAYAAAFRHTGFEPMQKAELDQISISISVLTPAEDLLFESESHLISQLEAHVDGLIFSDGGYRATFLPSVWEQVPDPVSFLRQLKQKAGLPPDYWSDSVSVSRYRSDYFAE